MQEQSSVIIQQCQLGPRGILQADQLGAAESAEFANESGLFVRDFLIIQLGGGDICLFIHSRSGIRRVTVPNPIITLAAAPRIKCTKVLSRALLSAWTLAI